MRAGRAAAAMAELLRDAEVPEGRLIVGYLETKRALADCFESFASREYGDAGPLEGVREIVRERISETFRFLPEELGSVRRYGAVHQRIYNYLSARVGQEVTGEELRVLTGDAVHTERRARELRDVGIPMLAEVRNGRNAYILNATEPDYDLGAWLQASRNLRDSKSMAAPDRERMLVLIGVRPPDRPAT